MDPLPILPSATDLERRRLESTIDQDLHSLSLGSLVTTTASNESHPIHSHSLSSISSVEYPRGFGEGDTGRALSLVHPAQYLGHHDHKHQHHGPHGTPRAAARKTSALSAMSEIESPVSTAGHHVSAVTLGEGVFRHGGNDSMDNDEFDPERSLGRLVGELGKVMGGRLSPRPTSPFAALSPPRSPSPFSSIQHLNGANLSFTLNRSDPLPSPPSSKSGSRSSGDSVRMPTRAKQTSRFSSIARELGNDIKARNILGQSTAHNVLSAATPGPKVRKELSNEKNRLRALQGERRTASAPARVGEADITGMTGLMATPAKGGEFEALGKNGDVGGDAGGAIPQSLATLHARLRALETENSLSRRRVRELENELDRARNEVESARRSGDGRLREVIGEKSALEDLIQSLRSHLSRLTVELEQNKALVSELRVAQSQPPHLSPLRSGNTTVRDELVALRREVERLGKEVHRLGGIVEEGLDTRRRARGERTVRMEEEEAARFAKEVELERERDDEVQKIRKDMERRKAQLPPPTPGPSRLRQGLHASAAENPTLMPPSAAPARTRSRRNAAQQNPTPPASDADDGFDSPTPHSNSTRQSRSNRHPRVEGPASPFPSIRAEDEPDFFSTMGDNKKQKQPKDAAAAAAASSWAKQHIHATTEKTKARQASAPHRVMAGLEEGDQLPPQTVLARVIAELEEDFAHYKAIYAELADQYKVLDAASAVAKRRVLAEHLKEVIDTLEQKADQIAALYDLLTYRDRPLGSNGPSSDREKVHKSVPDILRLVKDSLGEEGLKRLEEDGVGVKVRSRRV